MLNPFKREPDRKKRWLVGLAVAAVEFLILLALPRLGFPVWVGGPGQVLGVIAFIAIVSILIVWSGRLGLRLVAKKQA